METAVVLGATGVIGKAVTDALIRRNIHTKILVRDVDKYRSLYPSGSIPGEVNAIKGELDNNEALAKACEYADTIFACFSTSLRYWETDMVRWISRVSDLAAALQARLIYPGNISNFGRVTSNPINEETKQDAISLKGRLSIAIENRLARAAMEGATLTILRFPDVYGPAQQSLHITEVFEAAMEGKKCKWYGDLFKLHDFIYSADVGEALVRAALEPKAADSALHVPGPNPLSPEEWIDLVYSTAGTDIENPVKVIPKWRVNLSAAFNKRLNDIIDTYYLFEDELILDGEKYDNIVGSLKKHSHHEGIKATMQWYRTTSQ